MAVYRQIQVSFWQDDFVLNLTPEEKYFYIYLMTNSKTTQCGIYELPKKIIEMETGYNRETVDKLLKRFIDYKKILYSEATKEIMLINWIKYNFINSLSVKKCIISELTRVKNKQFVRRYITLCKQYGYRIDTVSIDLGEEQEEEQEEEKEKEQEQEEGMDTPCCGCSNDELKNNGLKAIAIHCQNTGFTNISPLQIDSLQSDIKVYGRDWVIDALTEADRRGKHRIDYVEGILENWQRNGKGINGGGGSGGNSTNNPKADGKGKKIVYDFSTYGG